MKIKKGGVIFLVLISLALIILINLIISQEAVPESISETPVEKISGSLGEIDPGTGSPKFFSEYKERADEFRTREQNSSYLKKEWTKILAGNKYFGPFLFYTDKFFSFFNPFWKITFGMEFSWSLLFFFHIFLWITIVIIVYFPLKEFFKNSLFGIFGGVIVASITGAFGVITWFAKILEVIFVKLWMFTMFVIIVILLLFLYAIIFKGFREESEEEELKRSKEKIKALGRVSETELRELGE